MDVSDTMKAAIAGVLAMGLSSASNQATAEDVQLKKCYSVVKSGKKVCRTDLSACAGQVNNHDKKDDDTKDESTYSPKIPMKNNQSG